VPVDLGLSTVDDMTIKDNMDVFEKNGFGFVGDLETGMLKLASVPFSKGTTFGPDDVHEMVRRKSFSVHTVLPHCPCAAL
jgi:DNA mismatch repair protein PMS2